MAVTIAKERTHAYELAHYEEVSIPVPWGHIAGRWYGDNLRQPILAIHGWMDNCGTFAKLMPILVPHRSVLCIDLPGHGRSSHMPVGTIHHSTDFVRVIRHIMSAYDWKTVSLLGHSMGATIIFQFASFFPKLVDLLISIDLIKMVYYPPATMPELLSSGMDRLLLDNERKFLAREYEEPPSYTYDECVNMLYSGSDQSIEPENCKYIIERNTSKSLKYPEKYYYTHDPRVKIIWDYNPDEPLYTEMIMRICKAKIPYLLIRGSESKNFSAMINEGADILENNNLNFETYTIQNGTHHIHLNNAEIVGGYIVEFLKKHNKLDSDMEIVTKAKL